MATTKKPAMKLNGKAASRSKRPGKATAAENGHYRSIKEGTTETTDFGKSIKKLMDQIYND